jgi:hypothetical protein
MSMILHMVAGTLNVGGDAVEVQTASITDQTSVVNTTGTSAASVIFQSDATVDYIRQTIGNTNDQYNWIEPADNAADYEIRATVVSGPTNGGTATGASANTWHSLASDVTFGVSITALDAATIYVVDIDISKDSGSTIAASGTITFRAEVVNIGGL